MVVHSSSSLANPLFRVRSLSVSMTCFTFMRRTGYTNATDFYRALARITSAVLLPLTTASLLAHVIVGSALEQMDMRVRSPCSFRKVSTERKHRERLITEVGQHVAERVHSGAETVDDVAKDLHDKLMLRCVRLAISKMWPLSVAHRNESTKQLIVEDIYVRSLSRACL